MSAGKTDWDLVFKVLRVNHWFKNLFVVAGWLLAHRFVPRQVSWSEVGLLCGGVLLACFISSVNYMVNEVTDARYDRLNPYKCHRPVASGRISPRTILLWALPLLICTLAVGAAFFPRPFAALLLTLFIAGMIYNVPPVRSKDIPVADALVEAINFPLRLVMGWFLTAPIQSPPPVSILIAVWALGAVLMSGKRLAEVRQLGDLGRFYRPTFKIYTQRILLILIGGYVTIFLGFFYHFARRLAPPLLPFLPALLIFFGWFVAIALAPNSVMVEPVNIFKKRWFFFYSLALTLLMGIALF